MIYLYFTGLVENAIEVVANIRDQLNPVILFVCCSNLYFLFQKFKVTTWPTDDYGSFYSGDSYIILNVSWLEAIHTYGHTFDQVWQTFK